MVSSTISTFTLGGRFGAGDLVEDCRQPKKLQPWGAKAQEPTASGNLQTYTPRRKLLRMQSRLAELFAAKPNRCRCQFPAACSDVIMRGRSCNAPAGATTRFLSSSMAEHPAVNRRVVGSSPTAIRNSYACLPSTSVSIAVGLEPTTLRLTAGCSAIELLRNLVVAPGGALQLRPS